MAMRCTVKCVRRRLRREGPPGRLGAPPLSPSPHETVASVKAGCGHSAGIAGAHSVPRACWRSEQCCWVTERWLHVLPTPILCKDRGHRTEDLDWDGAAEPEA